MKILVKTILVISLIANIFLGGLLYQKVSNNDKNVVYDLYYEQLKDLSSNYDFIINYLENYTEEEKVSYIYEYKLNLMDANTAATTLAKINGYMDESIIEIDFYTKQYYIGQIWTEIFKENKVTIDVQTIEKLKEDYNDIKKLINYLDDNNYSKSSPIEKRKILQVEK